MKWLFTFLALIPVLAFGQHGNYCGTYATTAPININGVSTRVYTGITITANPGAPCVNMLNCDHISFINCIFIGNLSPNGEVVRRGILGFNCHDILIRNCKFVTVSEGVLLESYSGANANLVTDSCVFQNMCASGTSAHAIQYNLINGAGALITNNVIENSPGVSSPSDAISFFKCNGTPSSNMIASNNQIRETGTSAYLISAGGILLGDGGGSYQSCVNNVAVNTGHFLFGIATGTNMTVANNVGYLKDPVVSTPPVGVQIANVVTGSTCANITVTGNRIYAYNTNNNTLVPYWIPVAPSVNACNPVTNFGNAWSDVTVTPAILPTILIPTCSIPAPSITFSPNTFVYYINAPISPVVPVNVGGAATSWSISPLQSPGLNFSTTSGTLSGTPIALKTKTVYVVAATNSTGQSSTNLTVTVIDHAPIISYSPSTQIGILGTPITTMTPIVSTLGGTPVSYSVTPALPPNLTLNTTTGVISGTGIALSPATSYTIQAFDTGGTGTASVTLSIVPPAPAIPNISFSPNTYTLPVNVSIVPIQPINIGGVAASWGISPSPPTGISFSTSTGILTGLPTVTQASTSYDVSATNISGTAHTTLHLAVVSVTPPAPVPSYSPSTITLTINQSAILLSPSNSGGVSTNWSVLPALPSGLVLSSTTGIISGVGTVLTPPTNYIISATNGGGTGTATINIQIVQQSSGNPIRVGGAVARFE